mgnify:CR=1 FL=1
MANSGSICTKFREWVSTKRGLSLWGKQTGKDGRVQSDKREYDNRVAPILYELSDHLGSFRVVVDGNTGGVSEVYNAYAFGLRQEYRTVLLATMRFAFNGQQKDDAVRGIGFHYDFDARRYDPVYGRFWSTDPKANSWESPYAMFGGNPILNTDVLLDKWKNKHETEKNNALAKKNELQNEVTNYKGDKNSKEYKKLNRQLNRAENAYERVNEKYTAVQNALQDLSIHNPTLYNEIENLQDPLGNNVDVYVGIQEGLYSDVFGGGGMNGFMNRKKLNGISDIQPDQNVVLNGVDVFSVKSHWYKTNTAVILIDAGMMNKGKVLSHEGGHVKYAVKNMAAYIKWLRANPGKSEGGHGGGNPSGIAADAAEANYK